ncbi:MAG: lamin tail domain-containing protein [Desulfobulbaceae bacterium]|nr:lamin tail domain-containing protein [Desulfobulbaceae bacterium]
MKKRWGPIIVFFSIVVCLIASGISNAEDRRTNPDNLTIMTLNAQFLWDGVEPEEGRVDFPWKNSKTEAEEHMSEIANIIIRNNPDIVNLVEVENEEALNALNNGFLNGRGYVPYFIQGRDSYTGEDVALLTRIDPESGTIARDDRKGKSGEIEKSVSKNYFAKFDFNGIKVGVIGLHFLAYPNREDRINKREAQADAIRSLAVELHGQGYQIVVLGDFNDYDADELSRDHIDSMPITNVLKNIKEMSSSTFDDNLVNAAQYVPKATRHTAFYDENRNGYVNPPNEFTSIDHVLLSRELAESIESVAIPHNHDPREVTDHFPVVVRLEISSNSSGGGTSGLIKITSLIPNPDGDENQNEKASLKNTGSTAINMAGWKLRDLVGTHWALDSLGTVNPGQEVTILRHGQSMAMNNGGDTIDLVAPNGRVIQSVSYSRVEEEEVVFPAD